MSSLAKCPTGDDVPFDGRLIVGVALSVVADIVRCPPGR